MGLEIERKYLVEGDLFVEMSTKSYQICQGYLSSNPNATVRVRIKGSKAYLTVKGLNVGATRNEWEYEVPVLDALEMLSICERSVEKTRYIVPYNGHEWEIDVFHGKNLGLTLAEIELNSEDEEFDIPPFVTKEVTGDPAYYNSSLAK